MNPETPPTSFAARFQGRPAFWGAAAGSLAGIIVGLAIGVTFVAQADNNRRTADVADGPLLIPYDGFLMLNNGAVDGEESLTFRLYGGPTCTDCELWSETQTVQLHSGRFSVGLGTTTALDALILDAEKLYLGIEVNGTPLSGRQAIEPVPYAAWSGHGTEFKTYSIATPGGNTSEVLDVQARLNVQGSQLALGTSDGRPAGANMDQSALLHSATGDQLFINAGGSFEGGTRVDSPLTVNGATQVLGDVDIDGNTLRFGSSNDRLASFASNRLTLNPGNDASSGVLVDSNVEVDGDLNMSGTANLKNVNSIEGDTGGLILKGRNTAPAVTVEADGAVTLPRGLSVAGFLYVGAVGSDLFMNSATESNRNITNVNSIHGDGTLLLYPGDTTSNSATLDADGMLKTTSLDTGAISITGAKSEILAGDSGYSVSTFFNENWADCGNKPITGVRIDQYTAGADRRARVAVRCGP